MEKDNSHKAGEGVDKFCATAENEEPRDDSSCRSMSSEAGTATCRVCQCVEPDRKGNIALGFLGISPPPSNLVIADEELNPKIFASENTENNSYYRSESRGLEFVEFISPKGEVFICNADVELGLDNSQDRLIELGCSCKGDLALAHYACALKWFINHGSTVCEICGFVANNIGSADFKKVLGSLKEYEALRERIVNGQPNPAPAQVSHSVDPDAVAAVRMQRLSEISLWFNPHNNSSVAVSHMVSEQQPSTSVTVMEEVPPVENTATKWAVEGTGILLATGLLTVTLAWLLAPHVGKVLGIVCTFCDFSIDVFVLLECWLFVWGTLKTAKNGLHILLGGVCALTVVVFFRFFVLTRIKYGPARYWAILFVFWFLVFGIWASRTHNAHAT
ncbi:RING/FYVE/PHD zinc finger superfamily protein [Striga asiatica]|uniref:RING/FYVE/PHD zinc finger superfamily protein n=1 Tax=Striga asiatica TaxID=4170 RepID=A0A5A7PSI1_STRAF|nr:RING/FYVE/PHD zinc finger superfamily protein [Striga asiatica]